MMMTPKERQALIEKERISDPFDAVLAKFDHVQKLLAFDPRGQETTKQMDELEKQMNELRESFSPDPDVEYEETAEELLEEQLLEEVEVLQEAEEALEEALMRGEVH
jgi:hypothetical protein